MSHSEKEQLHPSPDVSDTADISDMVGASNTAGTSDAANTPGTADTSTVAGTPTTPKPKLWTRHFILLGLIQTLDLFTYNMITPVIAQYATGQGFTLVMAGLIAGAFTFAALFARLPSGLLADTLGRKRIVLLAIIIGSLSQVGYAFANTFAVLFILRCCHGVFYALFGTAISAMAIDNIPAERRSEGLGYFGTSYVFANALGPALGVAISSSLGFTPMFLLGAGIAFATLILGLMLPPDTPKKASAKTANSPASSKTVCLDASAASTEEARKSKQQKQQKQEKQPKQLTLSNLLNNFISIKCLPLAFAACCYLSIWGIISTYIVMVGEARGVAGISAFFVVNSLTLLFTRPIAGKLADKRGLSAVFVPSLFFEAIAIFLIALSQQLYLFLFAAACKALGSGTVTPSIQAQCGQLESKERSSVAMSTYLLGTDIGYAIGPVIGGVVSARFGFEAMFFAGLPILALAAGVYACWAIARKRAARD